MIDNPLIFTIGGALAAVYFLAPTLFPSRTRPVRLMFVAWLYAAACAAVLLFADAKSALVVLELGIAFTVLGKLLVINFNMVHSQNHPKHRRCY